MSDLEEKKAAARERARLWYRKNRERALARAKKYREANKDDVNERIRQWRENNPERDKELKRLWAQRNSDHKKKLDRLWALNNAEKRRSARRKWYQQNKDVYLRYSRDRRARRAGVGGELSKDIVERLVEVQQGRCVYCDADLKETGMHLDHIVPIANGGQHSDDNVQITCPSCNWRKWTKSDEEFKKQMGLGE